MRRLPPAVLVVPVLLVPVLLLSACVPPEFDPATGENYETFEAQFAALSEDERLAAIADGDARVERDLWAAGDLEDALGGADAADEVFDGLRGLLAADVATLRDDGLTVDEDAFQPSIATAAFRDDVAEATGAGMFAGMLISDLLTEAGMTNTKGGQTGEATQDFGKGGKVTMNSAKDGTVSTSFELSTEYKGVKIQVIVGSEINPCPDPTGVLEPTGRYQVNVTGPDGAGTSTQIDLQMDIQLNDDAEIANSDFTYEAGYATRPQAATGGLFDFSSRSIEFGLGEDGFHTSGGNIAGAFDQKFISEAVNVAAFLAQWVAGSLEKSAQKGWEDGRCIDLQGAYSAGPKGLKPSASVAVTMKPIAKADGKPAGGTVSAKLTGGGKSITPGSKVQAPADFTYTAPSKKDEEGTVRFEARSRRGVGILSVTFDTKALQSYFMAGGGGDFYGEGVICDLGTPWQISGSGVVMTFTPAGNDGGSYSYEGNMGPAHVFGGEAYEVTYKDGEVAGIHGWGVGTVEVAGHSASGGGDEYYVLTPIDRPATCG